MFLHLSICSVLAYDHWRKNSRSTRVIFKNNLYSILFVFFVFTIVLFKIE